MSQSSNPLPNEPEGLGQLYLPQHELLHEQVQEDIVLSRWHLKDILVTIENERARASIEGAFPWFGGFLAFMLALLPRDYQAVLGLSSDFWTAISAIGASGALFMGLRVWWQVFKQRHIPRRTAADLVDEIWTEMRARREQQVSQALGDVPSSPQSTLDSGDSQTESASEQSL